MISPLLATRAFGSAPRRALSILKQMLDSFGPAGFELETAAIVKNAVKPYANESDDRQAGFGYLHSQKRFGATSCVAGWPHPRGWLRNFGRALCFIALASLQLNGQRAQL